MIDLEQAAHLLAWSYAGLAGGLLVRLAAERLVSRYRYFAMYLVADAISTMGPLLLRYDSWPYFWFWSASIPVIVACYFLVILELYGLVLADYPGIAGLMRWLVRICVPLVVLVSLVPTIALLRTTAHLSNALLPLSVAMLRTAALALLVFLALLEAILVWCPLRLNRNTVLYCAGYFVLFTVQTASLSLIERFGASVTPGANVLMQAISCACLLFWMVSLSRAGEQRDLEVGARWKPGEKDRVREQLQSINAIIFRMVKLRRAK